MDKGTWMYYSSVIYNGQNKHGLGVLFLNLSLFPKDSSPPLVTYAQNTQVLPRASLEKQPTEACKCILSPVKSTVERMKLHSGGPYLTNIRWLGILFLLMLCGFHIMYFYPTYLPVPLLHPYSPSKKN